MDAELLADIILKLIILLGGFSLGYILKPSVKIIVSNNDKEEK